MRVPGAVFDTRALALSRIATSALLLASLLEWGRDFEFLLSPDGIVPLEAVVAATQGGQDSWSLYFALPHEWTVQVLSVLTVVSTVALMLGWKTRVSGWIAFLGTLSLHNRCAVAVDSADALLLIALFAGILLPWDRCYAVGSPARPGQVVSWPFLVLWVGVWGVDLASHGADLSLAVRGLGLLVVPALLGSPGRRSRHLCLLIAVLVFVATHPDQPRLSFVMLAFSLCWTWWSGEGLDSKLEFRARPATVGFCLLLTIGVIGSPAFRGFLALGPRAHELPPAIWYALVEIEPDGPEGEERELRPSPVLHGTYRRRLLLGTLARGREQDLPYWMARSLFRKSVEKERHRAVQIWRCERGSDGRVVKRLAGQWPL